MKFVEPDVRLQALLALTNGREASEQELNTLIQAHDNRSDPRSGLPHLGRRHGSGQHAHAI